MGWDGFGGPITAGGGFLSPPLHCGSIRSTAPSPTLLPLQGDYVLVFTSRGHARLPSMWIMGAYRSLPRPFRKNVQHVVLVRPSGAPPAGLIEERGLPLGVCIAPLAGMVGHGCAAHFLRVRLN